MARIPWVFTDTVTAETYEFEINPREGGSPAFAKGFTQQTTTAGGTAGRTLLFEGADAPTAFDANGTLLTEAQYDALVEWYTKRVPIELLDDLGRTWFIYITALDFKRTPKPSHPWRHTFSFSSVLI